MAAALESFVRCRIAGAASAMATVMAAALDSATMASAASAARCG